MKIALAGSIANDYLMVFPGRFADQIVADQLDRLSLSFLVENLEVRRGGVAANIAYGLAQFGLNPVLIGAVGPDFDDYRAWLERHGVDTESVHVSDHQYTARFFCTTDEANCQIASFYAGAMSEARSIELAPAVERVGGVDLIVISPDDPEAMARHTDECRQTGLAFMADTSQQLARMGGSDVDHLLRGAKYVVCNDYELALIEGKTGWSHDDLLGHVDTVVVTYGAKGAAIERTGEPRIEVEAVPEDNIADPTGVGDGFRAGFLAGQARGLTLERSAQVGSLLATYVLERVGNQEYELEAQTFIGRFRDAFGADAAGDLSGLFGNP